MPLKQKRSLAMFLVPSVIGILIFMIPVRFQGTWTIIVKILADFISGHLETILPLLCVLILTVSSVMAAAGLAGASFIHDKPLLKECFSCAPVWVAVRCLGCLFAWLTLLGAGGNGVVSAISGPDQGGVALDLIVGLVIIFAIASFLLPLLLDFGLLEFVGALLTKYMRPLFRVPGRAAVDCITSWIGDGTLGVMLTCNQYEGGYYSAREASVISTTFSAVSITFSLVVLDQVGLLEYFGVYYLLICLVGIVCAVICPRIPPLSRKKDDYLVPGRAIAETLPEGFTSSRQYGLSLAMGRVAEHRGVGEFLSSGLKNCLSMWFGVLPTVDVHWDRCSHSGQLHPDLPVAGHPLPPPSAGPGGPGGGGGLHHHDRRLHGYVHSLGHYCRSGCLGTDPVYRSGDLRDPGPLSG